ncbi:MAG: hypothetical protein HC867_02940, partial [Bacteroidia bacterium]|nr:hypothetical protein [Bacteroidia bacterium]
MLNNIFVRSGIYPTTSNQQADYTIAVNGDVIIGPGCAYDQLIINVFDSVTFQPWRNNVPGGGLYGSGPLCGTQREYNFHFQLGDTSSRRKAMDFLNNIVPDGSYVSIRSNTAPWDAGNTYAAVWAADTVYYGSGNSLYHTLKNQGFSMIDDFDTTTAFTFVYKKNRQATFAPREIIQENVYEPLLLSVDCPTPDTIGFITSPVFGPAKEWKFLKWRGNSEDMTAGDRP